MVSTGGSQAGDLLLRTQYTHMVSALTTPPPAPTNVINTFVSTLPFSPLPTMRLNPGSLVWVCTAQLAANVASGLQQE